MKLNRYNYEEYFILYLDNELDSEGRQEVEAFVQANPDLKAELDMVTQSKLVPDTDISFTDKDALLRFDNSSISLANYEEWLTAYIDDEVTDEQRIDIETFIASNPAALNELNLLKQTKLQPETIVFPYKQSLYRKTEKARVVSLRWIRVAVAAILLLAISMTAIILMNNNRNTGNGNNLASQGKPGESKAITPIQQRVSDPSTSNSGNSNAIAIDNKINKTAKEIHNVAKVKENTKTPEPKVQDELTNEKKELADNSSKIETRTNNLPSPLPNNDMGTGQMPSPNGKMGIPGVTTPDDKTSIKETGKVTQDNPDIDFASESSSNKGIRGFLRKVTRTIEKRTNIKATDDDGRLLIAGLAIKTN